MYDEVRISSPTWNMQLSKTGHMDGWSTYKLAPTQAFLLVRIVAWYITWFSYMNLLMHTSLNRILDSGFRTLLTGQLNTARYIVNILSIKSFGSVY